MTRVIGEVKACYIKGKEKWTILKCAFKKLCHFNSEHPEDFVMCTISYYGKKTSTLQWNKNEGSTVLSLQIW